jgi:hypothetical protein
MSMNFNGNNKKPTQTPVPTPKKNNNKTIIGAVITVSLVVITTLGALYIAGEMNNLAGQFSPSSSYQPTASEITQMCTEKIRELLQTEPTQYMIDVCVRGANDELNSPNPLSANPTVSEITAKCTEIISKEYVSAPQLAVNICVGTALQGLNK